MNTPRRLCIFCGSSAGRRREYADAARGVGRELASRGIGLVYGAGNIGLMGIVADAALAAGGHVIGVIPRALMEKEVGHSALSDLRIVETMHERKAMMAELSDGFIALPGGYGTFEEFFEVITWAQLGFHGKPVGLLNVAGFFDPLLALVDHAVADGFIRASHRDLILVERDLAPLLDRMAAHQAPPEHKWIDKATL